VWYVDLAPITDPELVAVTVARALGLPDQPGRSTISAAFHEASWKIRRALSPVSPRCCFWS
jgi:predicted ATPase